MTHDELTVEAMNVFQALTVLSAVDGDNQKAMQEIPAVLGMLAHRAERVYCAILEGVIENGKE